jgi:hypothetical protein
MAMKTPSTSSVCVAPVFTFFTRVCVTEGGALPPKISSIA